MPDRFSNNHALRFLALILALCAWVYVRFISTVVNPHASESQLRLAPVVIGIAAHARARLDPQTITVVVDGEVNPDLHIRAVIDAAKRRTGTYRLPVTVTTDRAVLSLTPANVLVEISEESP